MTGVCVCVLIGMHVMHRMSKIPDRPKDRVKVKFRIMCKFTLYSTYVCREPKRYCFVLAGDGSQIKMLVENIMHISI